ncbi:MAG: type II secretion system F family protein [Sedimentisphaerales bacterium]|nr:type II secretion system F family protein [Sedimentisphaerales bacterium]
MSTFQYNALTSDGRVMKGTIEAASHDDANELLKKMHLVVNSIDKAAIAKPKTSIGRNEFLLFNQQLASITKAGIPLEKGLRELSHDVSSHSMRNLINDIASDLEAGTSIEQAFEKRQKRFPPLYGRILKAGVETGRLSEMLTSLNRHLEMANQTRRIIFEAISYPLVVFVLASIIVTGMFLFVIPQFATTLSEMTDGGKLPSITLVFFTLAQNVIPFWTTLGIVLVVIIILSKLLATTSGGRIFKESLLLYLPVLGRVYHSSVLSRMAEAMAILVAAGTDMPETLRLASGTTGSEILIYESDKIAKQIEQGTTILEAGHLCKMIPNLFLYSIQLGTQRNELQDNLYSLGQMYNEQAGYGQSRLQAVLFPLMIIFVGIFLMLAILSMFVPMISIITSLSSAG